MEKHEGLGHNTKAFPSSMYTEFRMLSTEDYENQRNKSDMVEKHSSEEEENFKGGDSQVQAATQPQGEQDHRLEEIFHDFPYASSEQNNVNQLKSSP